MLNFSHANGRVRTTVRPDPEEVAVRERLSRDLLVDADQRGSLATDALLAARASEHGTGVCSIDRDSARSESLDRVSPSL